MKRINESIADFERRYDSEAACLELVEKLRWPCGYRCPSCDYSEAYRIQSRRIPLFECKQCGHQTSLTAGTVMHRSKTPLKKWLLTMYLVALPGSINAVNLSELIGVTYKTSWRMLHIIRTAISETDGRERLTGHIEAKHELYMQDIWMIESRMKREKSVIIAREVETEHAARYKMKILQEDRQARKPLTEQHAYDFAAQYCSEKCLSFAMILRYPFSRRESIFEQEIDNRRDKPLLIHASPALMVRRHQVNKNTILAKPFSNNALLSNQPVGSARGTGSLSEAARSVYAWMSETFRGICSKYAQHYFDEFCFRLNHADWAHSELFQKLLSLSLGQATDPSLEHAEPRLTHKLSRSA